MSRQHPLAEFGALLAGVLAIGVALTVAAYLLAGALVGFIPYDAERAILASYKADRQFEQELTDGEKEVERYLQWLAERLLVGTDLPADLELRVHFSDSEQINAFATLGGHVVVNRGLLAALETENGLAMVLAHEIGHVLHRDPLLVSGRAAVTAAALALLSGFSQTSVANTLFSISADSLMLGFSRAQERAADIFALGLLQRYYGHRGGADEFFNHVRSVKVDTAGSDRVVEFFSTHPNLDERIERLQLAAGDSRVALVPLPVVFRQEP